uniref:Uncharacterized protein n=1 Tax=Leishmania guyanensis TaxID=5670 RepID=A0A1E1J6V5_LEIGU|nr:Hypothetical protein BN36_3468150 [Leishmania guyanensis]
MQELEHTRKRGGVANKYACQQFYSTSRGGTEVGIIPQGGSDSWQRDSQVIPPQICACDLLAALVREGPRQWADATVDPAGADGPLRTHWRRVPAPVHPLLVGLGHQRIYHRHGGHVHEGHHR